MIRIGKFTDFYRDVTKEGTKIPQEKYLQNGLYPVIDQGRQAVAGRWDSDDGIFKEGPAIVFGDHTRAIKYIEEPFFIGADGVKILRPVNPQDNPKYLFYALQAARIPDLGYSRHFKAVKELEIRVYSTAEQNEIVRILEKIDSLIEQRHAEVAYIDLLVKSRFIELFEGKYSTVRIGDVFETTSGGTPSKEHPEYYENGDIPWLTSGEVNAGIITKVKAFITKEGLTHSSAKMIPTNSVVVAMYGATAGQVGLLRIETSTNQAVCSILPNPAYIPEFLYYAVKSRKEWMIAQCAGGAQPNISQGVIKRMEIVNPPITLQEQFATFVKQTDKSKLTIQQSLDKLELMKKALMQKYFG